jgi:quinol monooxygenase YgiN
MNLNSEQVTVIITCQIQPGKSDIARRDFVDIIKSVVANEAACHGIQVLLDPEDSNRLLLIEYWDSKEVFIGPHMQTPHMQAFLQRAAAFLAATPVFGFWRHHAVAP